MGATGAKEGFGTMRRSAWRIGTATAASLQPKTDMDEESAQQEFVMVDGYSTSWRSTIAWSWSVVLCYLFLQGVVVLFAPADPAALAEVRAEVPTMVYEASVSAFFTAMCLNLTSFLFEDSSAKRQLALLCCIIKGIAAHADLMAVLGCSGWFYGPGNIPINPARIVQWLTTTPTMVFILSKITSLSNREITSTIVVDIILVMGGFMASLSPAPYNFSFFFVSLCGFVYVMTMMSRMTTSAMRDHDTRIARRSLTFTFYGTLFCWSLFPTAWLLPRVLPGTRLRVTELVNVAGNFLSKVLLSSSMIHGNYIAITEKDKQEVQRHIHAMRDSLSALQGEHAKLIRHQEVLQAELDIALHNYVPCAVIDEGTPADKMLQVIGAILSGEEPTLDDVMFVRSAIMESKDIYMPVNLTTQLQASQLDEDVSHNLLAQLTGHQHGAATALTASDGRPLSTSNSTCNLALLDSSQCDDSDDACFGTLQAALASILGTQLPPSLATLESCNHSGGSGNGLGLASTSPRSSVHANPLFAEERVPTTTMRRPRHLVSRPRTSGPGLMAVLMEGSHSEESDLISADLVTAVQAALPLMSPGPCILLEVEKVLVSVRQWQFDAFALAEASQNHPLSVLGYYLFHESGLIQQFSIEGAVLARFLRAIEEGYANNPYHNRTHAADVLQTMHVLLHGGGLVPGYAEPLTLMACYLAAIVHDYEHVGKTNDFLVMTNDVLALRYNDRAPLENHHLSAAFTTLRQPANNFLAHLQRADLDRLRKTIIELVLGTDMKQHFAIVSQFNTVHRAIVGTTTPGQQHARWRRSESADSMQSTASVAPVGDAPTALAFDASGDVRSLTPTDEAERILGLQMALKIADLGHISAKLVVHLKWVGCLETEFFAQGDEEKALGVPMSPLFDRSKPGVSKSQIGFFDVVTIPLFRSFSNVFPGARPLLTYVLRNYQYWEQHQANAQHANRPAT